MVVDNIELEFMEWLPKVSERLTFILLNIKEKRDLSDVDYDVLNVFHRLYYNGELPLYQSKQKLPDETAVRQGLFGQIDSTSGKGTKVVYKKSD